MTWFKVDDGLHSHPKWLAAGPHARALWVTAGSWAASHLTDGHVPRHALPLLGGRPRDAAELVRLELWHEDGDGWIFHDWAAFQPSAESVEAERAAARERQRRARERAKETRPKSRRDSRAIDGVSHGPPDPTRPSSPLPPHTTPAEAADTTGGKPPEEEATSTDQERSLPNVGEGLTPADLWPVMAERNHENLAAAGRDVPRAGGRRTAWLRRCATSLAEEHADNAREILDDYAPGTSAEAVIRALDPDLARHDEAATIAEAAAHAAKLEEWKRTAATPEEAHEYAELARQHLRRLNRGKVGA